METETMRLLVGEDRFSDDVLAPLFGMMADKAWPVVQHYRSDLYRDAQWLREHVTGPATFYFVARDMGTGIGTDWDFVRLYLDRTAIGWRVEVSQDRGIWSATFHRFDPETESFGEGS